MDEKDLERMNVVLRHTLRNFASGIKTAMSILSSEADGLISARCMEYFPLIMNECNRLDLMTKRLNLLFDSSSESAPGKARDVIEKLRTEIHKEHPTSNIEINADEETLKLVVPDAEAIKTALLEISFNAIEANHKKELIITCKQTSDLLRFIIEDKGKGVSTSNLAKIFEPFYTTKSSHIGVGLAIAKRFITRLGGKSTARENEYGGLTVELEIPKMRE